jgi:GT2 family glycosyltransferase/glycosyltransferase involved in cell wall biosynthesis
MSGELVKKTPSHVNGRTFHPDENLAGALFSPPNASFKLYGYVDGVHGRCVDGWIFDAASPDSTLTVEICDGTTRLGDARARLFRADLDAIGIGHHAFRFELPAGIFDGAEHDIWARLQNSGLALPGSPRRLTTGRLNGAEPLPLHAPAQAQAQARHQAVGRPVLEPPVLDRLVATLGRDDMVLRSLQAITEALIGQTRLLHMLLDHLSPLPSASYEIAPPEPVVDLLLPAVLARPAGAHDFLVFAIIEWNFRVQRPQHLSSCLAGMGNRVFYISIKFNELVSGGPKFMISGEPAEGVFEITLHCRPPSPVIYTGFENPDQVAELADAVSSMIGALGLRSPVCILQLPSWYPVVQGIPGVTLIFDCLDHLAGFNGVAPRVVELEHTLVKEADGVIVTSDFLGEIVGRTRSFDTIRNGVDMKYFSRPPETVWQPPGSPVIGYYGAISDWFDMELVVHCARRHPKWQFVLIGAVDGCDIAEAALLPNVTFLGEKPYDELTHYLYAFDVCLIPFKVVDLTRATNPVKVYEYLCAGKPVVATDLPELRRLPAGMVEVTESAAEFDKAIGVCLRQKDPALARRRQLWTGRHSWDVRARKLAGMVARQYPLVSVVVLCYNNLAFTMACLESVLAFSDYPDLEIICVDNASTDGTPDYLNGLAERHGFVRYIRNESNLGFAGGNNVGIRAARGEYVILLNNDTYVTRGWARDLIRPMQLDRTIGMTGPLTNMAGNEQKVGLAYADMTEMARASAVFTIPRRRRLYPIGCLAFFCVAIRRDVLEAVGDLDEAYSTGYFEDDDYCKRVEQAGYQLTVCDDVFVHHHHSASFSQLGDKATTNLMKRNRRIFEKRWGRWVPHAYRAEPGFGEG